MAIIGWILSWNLPSGIMHIIIVLDTHDQIQGASVGVLLSEEYGYPGEK